MQCNGKCGFQRFCHNSNRSGNSWYPEGIIERFYLTLTAKIELYFQEDRPPESTVKVEIHNSQEMEKFVHALQELMNAEKCFEAIKR